MKRGTPDHPKTAALAQALGCHRLMAIGLLEQLWHWTARYAPRGDVGRWPDETIAEGLFWDGKPCELIGALVKSGWLDADTTHRLIVHDWAQHADEAVKKALSRNKLDFVTMSRRRRDRIRTVSAVEALSVSPAVALPSLAVPEPSHALPVGPSDPGPRKNPLMLNRSEWEARWHVAVTLLSEAEGKDPTAVAAEHSRYPGGKTTKLNPSTMTDDRLMHTVLSLEAGLLAARETQARPPDEEIRRVCESADGIVDEFLDWKRVNASGEPLNACFTRWREGKGISFEAAAAAGLIRLAGQRVAEAS